MTTPTNGTHPSEQVDDRTSAQQHHQEPGSTIPLAAGGGLAATLLAWLLARWLGKRRQPTATERAVETAKNLGGASLTQGRRIGEQVQTEARPAVDKAGGLVRDVATLGAAGAVVGAAKVLEAGAEVGSRVASTGAQVAEGAVAASGSVADAAHDARKFGRKWTRRILFLVSLAAGFVAGSAAGRERYDQIVGAARSLTDRPEVQRAQAKARATVSGT
jgi:hypothetical protein